VAGPTDIPHAVVTRHFDDPHIARGMRAQLALLSRRLHDGDARLGWKVGFGAPAAMEKLGIAAPLVGFLTQRARLESGATVSLAGWKKPAAEAEIAVHMRTNLAGGANRNAAQAAIAGVGPAIELADVDFPPDDAEAILSGNIYQRHVILGACDASRAGCVLDGLTARISRDGAEVARTTDPQAATGELVDIVRHVADVLAALGHTLRAGEIIITGSITPPLWIESDRTIAFTLDPIGDVDVRFTGRATR
jgi:2-keto-4-pentenoate hydratase